jgi:hypothetical protein
MTLAELVAEVYTITNRADLVAQTSLAVRSATLKLHQLDYYYKDVFETAVAFDTAEYLQQLEYRTILPRWRALKYIRKFDSTGTPAPGVVGTFLDVVSPEQVLDSYAVAREDICYVAGEVIQIKSSTELSNILLGCYLNPDVGATTFSSWIATDHPFAIIDEAAARVFKMIGKTDEMAMYQQMAFEQQRAIQVSNIQTVGY